VKMALHDTAIEEDPHGRHVIRQVTKTPVFLIMGSWSHRGIPEHFAETGAGHLGR
jgi:hypothetical protein